MSECMKMRPVRMYDNELIAAKLRRWEGYLNRYRLPAWEEIPDTELYMEQLIFLLKKYLDYLPPELKEEQFITAATINNYVRTKVMPEPVKKRYRRIHIVYLIVVLTLKQSLSIAMIQKIMPMGLDEESVRVIYTDYVERHAMAVQNFTNQIRIVAGPILNHEDNEEISTEHTEDLITFSAISAGFSRLLAEKLLLLDGVSSDDPDVELGERVN